MNKTNDFKFSVMKRYIIVALAMLIMVSAGAQEALFKRYAGEDGITVVNISKSMLGLMSGSVRGSKKIKDMTTKIDRIRILSCENRSLLPKVKKDAMDYVGKKGYEELMSSQEGKELTYILQRAMGGGKYEYVVLSIESNEVNVINIIGRLTLDEIKSVSQM